MAGLGESKTGVRRLNAIDKQLRALELRKAGASFAYIAKEIGYRSPSGAHKAVMSALRRTLQEPAEDVRKMELERLDTLNVAVWNKARQGDLGAVDRVLKIMARRAELLGLDAPRKISIDRLIDQEARRVADRYELPYDDVKGRLADMLLAEEPIP